MVYDVDAIYDQGILRPVTPLGLADGARVHLRIEEENGECGTSAKQAANYAAWLEGLSGRWQGDFERGTEGTFETREPLS